MRDALPRGAAILVALVALLAAGEIAFGPDIEGFRSTGAALAALAAAWLLAFQQLYFGGRARLERYRRAAEEAEQEILGYQSQVRALERDRQYLRQQVETLSAHRELSRAASAHSSFDDFLDEIAGVVRDLAGARDITVFVAQTPGARPAPQAYYGLSSATELCLTFTPAGGLLLLEDMAATETGAVDSELLSARRLSITPMGAQVAVAATLNYRKAEVGGARLTLHHIDPESLPSGDTIASLLAAELGHVRLDCRNVAEAAAHRQPVSYDSRARMMELACPLVVDDEELGAVKVRFDCRSDGDREEAAAGRQRLLAESAAHIARALRSQRIYEQAIKDGLTGLYNKRYMMSQLESYFRVASRHGTHLSVVLLDIDHFKKVNDTYGHLTGDLVLRDVSAILLESVRDCDLACRYGGEELAVILPEGNLEGSAGLAERLRKGIESHAFVTDAGKPIKVTASLGVAELLPEMRRIEDLIAHADAALYHAKETGRNRAVAWNAELDRVERPTGDKVSRRGPPLRARKS